ncbi:MAG TPA: divalent-cation tolerance protein CutA [Longimicrobiales bacterium]|nr:divalent-cation tolerance protein CutA [Longimicrobiales bacterium]
MQARDVRIVLVTTPDVESARALARTLVEERLAACGNVVPGIVSVYRWQDAVREDAEALLVLKTSDAQLRTLTDRVTELHPYDVPEVLALGIEQGNQPYLEWLGACVAPGRRSDGT